MTGITRHPSMTESRIAFLKKFALDPTQNSLIRKLVLQDISFLGKPALEPLLEVAEAAPEGCPVRKYAIELLREFDKRHGGNGLDADSKAKLTQALQDFVAVEGLA